MTTQSQAASEAGPFKTYHAAQLLAKLAPIKRDASREMSSVAMRHKLNVQAIQLRTLVDELGAAELLGAHTQAIVAALASRSISDAVAACEAFELTVEGKALPVPVEAAVAPEAEPEPAPAPAPIETPAAPIAPANDNDHDPDRALPVPVPAQEAPDRDHPSDATCSQKEEQFTTGLPAGFFANREPTPSFYGPMSSADELGETVRAARTRKGMSQQEVALAAGVGRRFVGELEGGKATSEIGRVFAVCRVLGLSIVAFPV